MHTNVRAVVLMHVSVFSFCGCGSSLTRTQAEAQRVGIAYLESTAREAAAAAGAEYMGCDRAAARTAGSGESFTVEACGSRVDVSCSWNVGGGPLCTAEPEIEAAVRAREERAQAARLEAARREAVRREVSPSAAPAPFAAAAAFHVDADGVLVLRAVNGFVELHIRASRAHPSKVLVTITLAGRDSPACDHDLTLTAAEEPLTFEAERRDGSTSHYLLDADLFATLPNRLPLRATVCGQSLPFGHPALRALSSFIEAQTRIRAATDATGAP